jgi:hypothetical protein
MSAMWQTMLDAGTFTNFPGFLKEENKMSEAKEHLTNELRKHFSTPEAEELTEAIVGLIAVISGGAGQQHKLSKAEQIAADDKAAIEAHQAKLEAEAAATEAEREQAELAADVADPGDEDGDEHDEHEEHEEQEHTEAGAHATPRRKKSKKRK